MITLLFSLFASIPFVTVELREQLGNQMFEIAAAYAHALEHGAELRVPDLNTKSRWGIERNAKDIFFRVNAAPLPRKVRYTYEEKNMPYEPIPFKKDMELKGLFFSEKFFKNYEAFVRRLYAPSEEIVETLKEQFPEVFSSPLTVAVHIRTYEQDDPEHDCYLFLGYDYFKEAMARFSEEALFVVCSDDIDRAEEELAGFRKKMLFVKSEAYTHDLILMSFCHHNILSNSTFSWWSAYLNENPGKIVMAPSRWYTKKFPIDQRDYYPESWIIIENGDDDV